jgi:hypothetical protein
MRISLLDVRLDPFALSQPERATVEFPKIPIWPLHKSGGDQVLGIVSHLAAYLFIV